MKKMIKFNEWEQVKLGSFKEVTETDTSTDDTVIADLIARLDELTMARKRLIKNANNIEAQILEVDIKLIKLEMEKHDLENKKKQLQKAQDISKERNVEGKIEKN
jgi:predicted nuclease with TOPRIM domain